MTGLKNPDLDLNQQLCIDKTGSTDKSGEVSSLSRIIESYAALKQYSHPILGKVGEKLVDKNPYNNESYNKVVEQLRSITRRYPDSLRGKCRTRRNSVYRTGTMTTCLDAILGQGNNWRIIDLNVIPTDIFLTNCRSSDGKGAISSYESVIDEALKNGTQNHSVTTAYANTLLDNLLTRARFDKDLLDDPHVCTGVRGTPTTRTYENSFDYMLNQMQNGDKTPYSSVNSVVKRFMKDGVLDTSGYGSIFTGEHCTTQSTGDDKPRPENCLDFLLSCIVSVTPYSSDKINKHSTTSDTNAFNSLSKLISSHPRYANNPCRVLDIVSKSYSANPSTYRYRMMYGQVYKILGVNEKDIRENIQSTKNGALFDALNKSSSTICMIADDGKEKTFLDYMSEKPMLLSVILNHSNNNEVYDALDTESCVTKYGAPRNCLAKIIDEWTSNSGNENYTAPISTLANISMNVQDTTPKRSPKTIFKENNKTRFIDYVVSRISDIENAWSNIEIKQFKNQIEYVLSTVMIGGYLVNLPILDSVISNLSKITQSEMCKPYVDYIALVDKQEHLTDEQFVNLLDKTEILFRPTCMPASVKLLNYLYNRKIPGVNEIIVSRFTPEIKQNAEDPTFRFNTDKFLHEISPGDPRYAKEALGISKVNPVIEFYNKIHPKERNAGKGENEFVYVPNAENRWKYDYSCLRDMNAGKKFEGSQQFIEEVISNPEFATTMREDEFGIVGSYEINFNSGRWSDERLSRYANATNALINGGGRYVGFPYLVPGHNNLSADAYRKSIDIGLDDALKKILKSESIGQRKDKRTGTPHVLFHPNLNTGITSDELQRNNNDVTVTVKYIDDETGTEVKEMTKVFPFMEIMIKLPRKIMKELQANYKDLFGLMQLVTDYELDQNKRKSETYRLNISNRPIDLLRLSVGHRWDFESCMRIGSNPNRSIDTSNNVAIHGYIDFRSYVAYITKDSPYEPKWFGRMSMHRCIGKDETPQLSVQHDSKRYDVGSASHVFTSLISDAMHIIGSDNNLNKTCVGYCTHYWHGKTDSHGLGYYDYTDNDGKCFKYDKNSNLYKDILAQRTGQTEDSTKFVKKVMDTF